MTDKQRLFLKMYSIRCAEELIAQRYPLQKMRTPVHLSIGQEACAVGVCHFLNNNDLMVSTHRGHAHYLAKGGNRYRMFSELHGRDAGCSRGMGGSMHLIDKAVGFKASTSIVAGTIPIGVGLAWSKKLKKEDGIVVVCLGDAAVEEGVFHESMNFAALHKLPVLFVLENNLYSCFTHLSQRQPDRPFSKLSEAHNIQCFHDRDTGNNVYQVVSSIERYRIMEKVKDNSPSMLVLDTYRRLEHCGVASDDHLNYRDELEQTKWKNNDPLILGEEYLKRNGEWTKAVHDAMKEIEAYCEIDMRAAEEAPYPSTQKMVAYEYRS